MGKSHASSDERRSGTSSSSSSASFDTDPSLCLCFSGCGQRSFSTITPHDATPCEREWD